MGIVDIVLDCDVNAVIPFCCQLESFEIIDTTLSIVQEILSPWKNEKKISCDNQCPSFIDSCFYLKFNLF